MGSIAAMNLAGILIGVVSALAGLLLGAWLLKRGSRTGKLEANTRQREAAQAVARVLEVKDAEIDADSKRALAERLGRKPTAADVKAFIERSKKP